METLNKKIKTRSYSLDDYSKFGDMTVKDAMNQKPTEGDFARFKAVSDAELESFRALVQLGQGALRTSLLINGGATVALWSFFAVTISSIEIHSAYLKQALLIYGFGVFIGAIASGVGYVQAYSNYNDDENQSKMLIRICIFLVFLSYLMFFMGSVLGYFGLTDSKP